ncbi:unnamed protein product [Cuscuta campestris]|uniref:Uncharacterized protein n=1 Tax=Cuscuta campestris TaxID=132261 RepID=A0A484N9N6_9ASTE|nr:unnamed protein product [Cuscuta campestris]
MTLNEIRYFLSRDTLWSMIIVCVISLNPMVGSCSAFTIALSSLWNASPFTFLRMKDCLGFVVFSGHRERAFISSLSGSKNGWKRLFTFVQFP